MCEPSTAIKQSIKRNSSKFQITISLHTSSTLLEIHLDLCSDPIRRIENDSRKSRSRHTLVCSFWIAKQDVDGFLSIVWMIGIASSSPINRKNVRFNSNPPAHGAHTTQSAQEVSAPTKSTQMKSVGNSTPSSTSRNNSNSSLWNEIPANECYLIRNIELFDEGIYCVVSIRFEFFFVYFFFVFFFFFSLFVWFFSSCFDY